MHVYSLSLGRETEKCKEYLAVSPGSCSLPAAVQLICPLQRGVLFGVDVLPLLNTFSNTSLPQYKFHQLNTTHMEMGPGPFLPSLPSPLLGKSYILQKRSAHILSSLSQGKERALAGPILWKPHTWAWANRTGRRAGMPQRFIWLLFLAFDDTV